MTIERRVVIVEDDASIAELIEYNLAGEGYTVSSFRNGLEFSHRLSGLENVCLFILDIMLPGMDGFEICARLRARNEYSVTPVIMLTARASEADKVRGLGVGADDYITKPFGIREFLARVATQIRRYEATCGAFSVDAEGRPVESRSAPGSVNPSFSAIDPGAGTTVAQEIFQKDAKEGRDVLRAGPIVLDDIRHRVYLDDEEIEMTHREYELLKYLMRHRGVAFSRDDLLNRVWGYEYIGETRTVDVHVRQLRKKLEKDGAHPEYLETVRGRGYRFRE
ncbi:MAG: response regulator transcription factor [Oscillospiraceae bacterium]|nr:response regulator transcription factor [Oscillospiraceae bacterium]